MVLWWKHWGTRKGASRGAAWLSSARVVRCWVKSRNERNPCPMLSRFSREPLGRLPRTTRRKVGTTSSHHGLYVQGYTRATMARNRGTQDRKVEQIPKTRPSSDCGLQFAHMKVESLVIADQQAAVNTFPGLVHTARHTTKASYNRSPASAGPSCGWRLG